jgi:hypothetical protein
MVVKYSKWPEYITTFSVHRSSIIFPNWYFWSEKKPSGNPVRDLSPNFLLDDVALLAAGPGNCFPDVDTADGPAVAGSWNKTLLTNWPRLIWAKPFFYLFIILLKYVQTQLKLCIKNIIGYKALKTFHILRRDSNQWYSNRLSFEPLTIRTD